MPTRETKKVGSSRARNHESRFLNVAEPKDLLGRRNANEFISGSDQQVVAHRAC